MTDEEKYKLALFMVVRNSKVMPAGLSLGKSMLEINRMSIETCEMIIKSIDFQAARKDYEDGEQTRRKSCA